MVKISVIIPVYNSNEFLRNCLDSLCNQTLRDIEIICVNDCSTDNSLDILEDYARNDNRIKIINLEKNKGAAIARNTTIKEAKGEYLGFVDADDFIDLNFYETLYNKAQETEADCVKGNLLVYCPKKKVSRREEHLDLNAKIKLNKANFYFSFTSAIYRASFISEYKINFLEGLIHFEDPYFTIKAALFYRRLEVINNVYYYYVDNPNSTSRKNVTSSHINSLISGVGLVLDLLDKHCTDKTHYIIVFNFLLEQLLCWCDRVDVSDEINKKAISCLFVLYSRCRFRDECLTYHFLKKKQNQKQAVINELRNKVKNDLRNS